MQVNKNRQLITLQQTLAYLKYLNRQKPFNKEDITIPTKDYQEIIQGNKIKLPNLTDKNKKMKIDDDEDYTKKINKNRAIKRIIQSAFTILQGFNSYEEQDLEQINDKSSEIQFNIYLKQYNRVLEMIFQKQKERMTKEDIKAEKRQQILQNIFQYIVVQDFREILPIAIVKDKISKNNVEIMINALSDNLVVLKQNQLKIYDSPDGSGAFKSIKLHQIQNVDYHTQPYIFIVLTIQKDKERSNIYLKFQTQKNQQKWDRALYCCYIGRKMKTKQKFFLIEYPQQDVKKKQIQQTKKTAHFGYDKFSKNDLLGTILNEDRSRSISQKKQGQDESSNKKISQTKSIKKNQSIVSKQQISDVYARSNSYLQNKSKMTVNIDKQNNLGFQLHKNQSNELINRNKTDYINRGNNNVEENLLTPNRTPRENNYGKFSQVSEVNKQKTIIDFSQPPPQKQLLPEDIKQIHDLQRKHIKGIILVKQKFFFNKQKILYLKQNHELRQKSEKSYLDIQSQYQAMNLRYIEYWNFDEKTGQKSQKKVIKVLNINKYEINKNNNKSILICYDNNKKQIIFNGQQQLIIKQIYIWIDLIQNIYKNKLINQINNK